METSNITINSLAEATFKFRSFFYAVTPAETTFEKLEDVPHIFQDSAPYFWVFFFFEFVISILKGHDNFLAADVLTSAGSGMIARMPKFVFLFFLFTI